LRDFHSGEAANHAFDDVLSLAERYQLTTYDALLGTRSTRRIGDGYYGGNLIQAAGAVKVAVSKDALSTRGCVPTRALAGATGAISPSGRCRAAALKHARRLRGMRR